MSLNHVSYDHPFRQLIPGTPVGPPEIAGISLPRMISTFKSSDAVSWPFGSELTKLLVTL